MFFIVFVFVFVLFFIYLQRVFVATSRQLRRIESVSRSPIYNHFFETINGTSTIRAYSQQQRFITESYRRVDESQVAHYPAICANRYLSLMLPRFIIYRHARDFYWEIVDEGRSTRGFKV